MLTEKELNALSASISNPSEKYFKGTLYGEFGTRKTSTALRCSRKRAVLIHADKGWNIIYNHKDEFPVPDKVIPVEYEALSQIKAILEAVLEQQKPFDNVDLIVLDTWSQMQERYVDWLGENFEIKGRDKVTPKPGHRFPSMELVGMSDYHLTRNKMRPIIDLLVQAPVDVIFLTHVREPSPFELQKGQLLRRPNVTDAVWKILGRDSTFIGFMDKKKGNYITNFTPSSTLSAKSQIPELTDQTIQTEKLPEILWKWKEI